MYTIESSNEWAIWLVVAFFVVGVVGMGLLTAWANSSVSKTITASSATTTGRITTNANTAATVTAPATSAPMTIATSKATPSQQQQQQQQPKPLYRDEEMTPAFRKRRGRRIYTNLDAKNFNKNAVERGQKHVMPQVILSTHNRQPPKRPTALGPGQGMKSGITKADVDVIYDEYNWSAIPGCFNENGVYEDPFYPISATVED